MGDGPSPRPPRQTGRHGRRPGNSPKRGAGPAGAADRAPIQRNPGPTAGLTTRRLTHGSETNCAATPRPAPSITTRRSALPASRLCALLPTFSRVALPIIWGSRSALFLVPRSSLALLPDFRLAFSKVAHPIFGNCLPDSCSRSSFWLSASWLPICSISLSLRRSFHDSTTLRARSGPLSALFGYLDALDFL